MTPNRGLHQSHVCKKYGVLVVGHKPPSFPLGEGHLFIGSTCPPGGGTAITVDDESLGACYSGKVIAEYFQLFYFFLNAGRPECEADFYYIYQYRKFLSRTPGDQRAKGMPYLYAARPDDVASRNIADAELERYSSENKELIGPILSVGTLASNYSKYHVVEDFVAFSVALRESALFTPAEVNEFINYPYLIPSPSVGFFLMKDLIVDLKNLAVIWQLFHSQYYKVRSGYQRRVGGFLLERLHSFMIMKRALNSQMKNIEMCHQYVVTEDGFAKPTI
jgi:hypothetical protein